MRWNVVSEINIRAFGHILPDMASVAFSVLHHNLICYSCFCYSDFVYYTVRRVSTSEELSSKILLLKIWMQMTNMNKFG